MVKRIVREWLKRAVRRSGVEITFPGRSVHNTTFINLKPEGRIRGSALLALIIEPFLLRRGQKISSGHTSDQESLAIARVFLDLGYEVDIISKLRTAAFIPRKNYAFYVNHRTNFEKYCGVLNEDCIKVVHIDVSHWLFSNHAATGRAFALRERRGIAMSSIRHITENRAIERCDYATMLGNDYTIGTYRYAGKPVFRTRLPTYRTYEWPETKQFDTCRGHFLWFGSSGFVHKGLDLLLEIVSRNPRFNLTVCGPVDEDPDFRQAFWKELYETPNIHTHGWVDVDSPEFIDIANRHSAILFPSCAEGSNGGVITCMQAGLIPVASEQSGVDIHADYGFVLKSCDPDEILHTMNRILALGPSTLKKMAHRAWTYARENHTIDHFRLDYRNAIEQIMKERGLG